MEKEIQLTKLILKKNIYIYIYIFNLMKSSVKLIIRCEVRVLKSKYIKYKI